MKEWSTISDIIEQMRSNNNPTAFNDFVNEEWISFSTEETLQKIEYLTLALDKLGIKKGTPVGIMSSPCTAWSIVSLSLLIKGAVVIPLFPNISEENFLFEVKETGMRHIFVRHLQPIPILDTHRNLFDKIIEMTSLDELYKDGEITSKQHPGMFDELLKDVKAEELATIVYTSATTGMPKGVRLTQKNLVGHMANLPVSVRPDSRYLNVIPLAHIFGYTLNLLVLAWGGSIYYSADPKNFVTDSAVVHPTLTAVVPRLLEKLYLGFLEKLSKLEGLKGKIGKKALEIAYTDSPGLLYRMFFSLWDELIYSKFRTALGGSYEMIISGGAPLNPRLNHFYQNIGLPVREGWGMTEACPVTVNPLDPSKNKVGTVGIPFDGWKIKLGEDDEVLVKGTGVMQGYHNNSDLTEKTLDKEGWLHTGDKGAIDSEGYLTIIGRIKDLYKTSTGEWVAPAPIEQMICRDPLIEMAMVVAEGRKFASALLFPNLDMVEKMKKENNAIQMSDEEFLQTPLIQQRVADHIEQINEHLNHWEQLHAFHFISKMPSIELGEMTPSLKLRREVVREKYKHLIDAMYEKV